MTAEEFQKLTNNQKWDVIWNNKITDVIWCCASCGKIVDSGTKPLSLIAGGRYCGNCDSLLTKRTGGGQNMPCNYTFIPNRKIKIKKIIKNISDAKNR